MNLLTVEQYLKLISGADIKQICEPLFKNFGINFFAYIRVYEDGSRISVTSEYEFIKWVYSSKFSVASSVKTRVSEGLHFVYEHTKLMPRIDARKSDMQAIGGRNHFNIDTLLGGCEIIKKPAPNYCEVFDFGSPAYSPLTSEFYINNQDVLNHFILYFKEKAKDIIDLAVNNRLAAPAYARRQINQQRKAQSIDLAEAKTAFFNEINLQRLAVEGDYGKVYLTRREIECLLYLIRGRSAKETANILNISSKSVESYIKQVKEKLSCYKRSQLIDKAIDMNLITISSLSWLISKK